MNGKLEVFVQRLAARSKHLISEALKRFIAVDNARALVPEGELSMFREVCQSVLPNFDKETYPHARVTEGEGVFTLRKKEQEKQQLFVDTSTKVLKEFLDQERVTSTSLSQGYNAEESFHS